MNYRRWMLAVVATLMFAASFVAGRATADQPHMLVALDHLRAARGELQQATHDKGGFREKALKSVDQAIAQVQRGIEFDRKH
jgi:hypothetical protein